MTTPSTNPNGEPSLPPPRRDLGPDAVAMALRDPEVLAGPDVPYLPPAAPPKPALTTPPVFDAKTMVDATKRKVENPAYGHMPKGTPEGRAAAEAARAKMRRKRRRNKIVGWVMTIVVLGVIGGVSYALYRMYKDDQAESKAEREANTAEANAAEEPGALTPLGEQAEVIEALDEVNSGARPSAGALVAAAEDAQEVVDQINGQPTSGIQLALDDVMPAELVAVATELQPLDGFTRYVVVVDDAARAEPLSTPGWIMRLQSLPQAPELSPGLTLVPAVGPGEIAIALQTDGEAVTRLVVLSTEPEIRVDL